MPVENTPILEVRGVGKQFRNRWAVQDVSLRISAGEIVGIMGPNGAGKTTLLRLLTGLTAATTGELVVLGQKIDGRAPSTPPGIGFLPEHAGFMPFVNGAQNLSLLSRLRNRVDKVRISAVLKEVGLDPADRRPVRAYSLGMRQRLNLAQALLEPPQLLLCDEPTNGLDPTGIASLRAILRRTGRAGAAIVLASHMLPELERLCDRVVLMHGGRIKKEFHLKSAMSLAEVTVPLEHDLAALRAWATDQGISLTPVSERPLSVRLPFIGSIAELIHALVHAGIKLESIGPYRGSLEADYHAALASQEIT